MSHFVSNRLPFRESPALDDRIWAVLRALFGAPLEASPSFIAEGPNVHTGHYARCVIGGKMFRITGPVYTEGNAAVQPAYLGADGKYHPCEPGDPKATGYILEPPASGYILEPPRPLDLTPACAGPAGCDPSYPLFALTVPTPDAEAALRDALAALPTAGKLQALPLGMTVKAAGAAEGDDAEAGAGGGPDDDTDMESFIVPIAAPGRNPAAGR